MAANEERQEVTTIMREMQEVARQFLDVRREWLELRQQEPGLDLMARRILDERGSEMRALAWVLGVDLDVMSMPKTPGSARNGRVPAVTQLASREGGTACSQEEGGPGSARNVACSQEEGGLPAGIEPVEGVTVTHVEALDCWLLEVPGNPDPAWQTQYWAAFLTGQQVRQLGSALISTYASEKRRRERQVRIAILPMPLPVPSASADVVDAELPPTA